jgi:hypothetical protein
LSGLKNNRSGEESEECDMADAKALIEEINRELREVEVEIRRHAYLDDLEAGLVRREDLRFFAGSAGQPGRTD